MSDAAKTWLSKQCARILYLTNKNHNRHGYEKVVALMDEMPENYWPVMGWDDPKKRWIEHHYYLNRLTLPLRKLHGWIYQKFSNHPTLAVF